MEFCLVGFIFILFYIFEPHPASPRAYSWLRAQGILLTVLGEIYRRRKNTLGVLHMQGTHINHCIISLTPDYRILNRAKDQDQLCMAKYSQASSWKGSRLLLFKASFGKNYFSTQAEDSWVGKKYNMAIRIANKPRKCSIYWNYFCIQKWKFMFWR